MRQSSDTWVLFEDMGSIQAKGYDNPIKIFIYTQSLLSAKNFNRYEFRSTESDRVIVGRKNQLDTLKLSMKDYVDESKVSESMFFFLEGEEGIGGFCVHVYMHIYTCYECISIYIRICNIYVCICL